MKEIMKLNLEKFEFNVKFVVGGMNGEILIEEGRECDLENIMMDLNEMNGEILIEENSKLGLLMIGEGENGGYMFSNYYLSGNELEELLNDKFFGEGYNCIN